MSLSNDSCATSRRFGRSLMTDHSGLPITSESGTPEVASQRAFQSHRVQSGEATTTRASIASITR